MTILDRLQTENLRYRRMPSPSLEIQPHEPQLDVTHEAIYDLASLHNGYTYETAHKTELRVVTTWYANDAQFRMRKDHAEKELIYFLYGDILGKLNGMKSAAYDRDFERVLLLCQDIEKVIHGDR